MRTECSRSCWIAAGVAGLLVGSSVAFLGGSGWLAGLVLGLLTAWMLGGILVWGLCQGAGNRADNEALLADGWRDEPFTPVRRVVRAGGEAVSEEPLALAERIPGGAPLHSLTLTPADNGGAPARPSPQPPATAGPGTPPRPPAAAPADGAAGIAAAPAPEEAADPRAADAALIQPAPAEAQVAHRSVAPVEGILPQAPELPESESEAMALQSTGLATPAADAEAGADDRAPEGGIEPLVTTRPDAAAAEDAAGPDGRPARRSGPGRKAPAASEATATAADDLTRIRGVGPMLSDWLAGYGVTRFAQIAAWDDADIARYAGMMGRMGHRIRAEDWVGQARLLAAGGETAHSHAADAGEAS